MFIQLDQKTQHSLQKFIIPTSYLVLRVFIRIIWSPLKDLEWKDMKHGILYA